VNKASMDVRIALLEQQVELLTKSVKNIEDFVSKAKIAFAVAVTTLLLGMVATGSGTISLKSLIEWFSR
jgi:hypothetical protein